MKPPSDDKKNSLKYHCHWSVWMRTLYLVNNGDGSYFAYQVPASDNPFVINLADEVLSPSKCSNTGTYTREEVLSMARRAGHTEEQIEAALLLADCYDPVDEHVLGRITDAEYE